MTSYVTGSERELEDSSSDVKNWGVPELFLKIHGYLFPSSFYFFIDYAFLNKFLRIRLGLTLIQTFCDWFVIWILNLFMWFELLNFPLTLFWIVFSFSFVIERLGFKPCWFNNSINLAPRNKVILYELIFLCDFLTLELITDYARLRN